MLVFVGCIPRSGSSLMMRILAQMGFDPLGAKFPSPNMFPPEHNPEGYWELLPWEYLTVINMLEGWDKQGDYALKLLPLSLPWVPENARCIWTVRDAGDILRSMDKVFPFWSLQRKVMSLSVCHEFMMRISGRMPTMQVRLEDLCRSPLKQLMDLGAFLQRPLVLREAMKIAEIIQPNETGQTCVTNS